MSFIEPSPALYAFLFLQTFLYVPIVVLLAVLRVAVARAAARFWAFGCLVLAAAALFAQFGPALLNLYEGPLPILAGQATRLLAGLFLPLVVSAPLVISAFVTGRRWWGIDLLHGLALATLLGLFVWTRFV